MSEERQLHIQKEGCGGGGGTEVELVKDEGSKLTLRNIKLDMEYSVSRQTFEQHYEPKGKEQKNAG